MSRLLARRLPVLVLTGIVLLVACGLALAKGHRGPTCSAHKGTTILETSRVRVYRLHKAKKPFQTRLYACQRTSRHTYSIPLGRTRTVNGTPDIVDYDGNLQTAGPYVAWKQTVSTDGSIDSIEVLDTRSGHYATAASLVSDTGLSIPDFVLNTHRTVVWLYDAREFGGETVEEWNNGTKKTLDRADAADQITNLALSKSGRTAYWLNNGTPKSARLP
jgi:hypothetical protein